MQKTQKQYTEDELKSRFKLFKYGNYAGIGVFGLGWALCALSFAALAFPAIPALTGAAGFILPLAMTFGGWHMHQKCRVKMLQAGQEVVARVTLRAAQQKANTQMTAATPAPTPAPANDAKPAPPPAKPAFNPKAATTLDADVKPMRAIRFGPKAAP